MTKQEFTKLTQSGTVFLDGATGSYLRKHGMPVGVSTELWAIEHPEVIMQLQRDYAQAGSQIVYAPTFSANRLSLSMHGLEDRLVEINTRGIEVTKRAVDGKALVAGDLATTGKTMEPYGDMTYQTLMDVYQEQIEALANAGADLLIGETMLSIDELSSLLDAAHAVCDLPVMCTLTINSDGTLYYGGTIMDAVETLQEMGAAAVGLNCSVGPDQLEAVVRSMKKVAKVPIIVKPNAGMPLMDDRGVAHYNMKPETFADCMKQLTAVGADIIGGCCGTDPDYIRAMVQIIR